ncbi:hypothetical protein ABMA28_009691 [Loxostege sticticalis]|uniref:Uncharacterized protein n=1 Tax=Loxostege sticticalis TaxID=481309 RepID=A0ABD0SB54_LOXSC
MLGVNWKNSDPTADQLSRQIEAALKSREHRNIIFIRQSLKAVQSGCALRPIRTRKNKIRTQSEIVFVSIIYEVISYTTVGLDHTKAAGTKTATAERKRQRRDCNATAMYSIRSLFSCRYRPTWSRVCIVMLKRVSSALQMRLTRVSSDAVHRLRNIFYICFNLITVMNDMKAGSNTSMHRKSTYAVVQTLKKSASIDNFRRHQSSSQLKFRQKMHITDRVNPKSSTPVKEDIKKLVKKSISRMKSANKEFHNAFSKSITKLGNVLYAIPDYNLSLCQISSISFEPFSIYKCSKKPDFVTYKSGSKRAVEDLEDAANKRKTQGVPADSKGTQFICGCRSAYEFLKRMQNQSVQTKKSKLQSKDSTIKLRTSKAVGNSPTKIHHPPPTSQEEEPASTETETSSSGEGDEITKVKTPSKRSKASAQAEKSSVTISPATSVTSVNSKKIKADAKPSKKSIESKEAIVKKMSDSKKPADEEDKMLSDSKKPAHEKDEELDEEGSDCLCKCDCSDAEGLDEAKKMCTCATQYAEIDENNLQREIFDFTSTSCSGSDTLLSSTISSDPSCTDCTICGIAYVDDKPKRKKRRNVSVITKANQATGMDKPKLCDVSTLTKDWWSPLVEKKGDREITFRKDVKEMRLEKSREYIGDQVRQAKRNEKSEGRIVTFKSQAQIIPTVTNDILSPSRYLLESQWYYNELFSSKFYAPHLFPVSLVQKPVNGSRNRPPSQIHHQTRRNHKTKRLDECYSPRKQISPRRQTAGYEWIRTNEHKDRYQGKKLLRKHTRPNNTMKTKHPHLKHEKKAVASKDDKFGFNDAISLEVRCNSTSSFVNY